MNEKCPSCDADIEYVAGLCKNCGRRLRYTTFDFVMRSFAALIAASPLILIGWCTFVSLPDRETSGETIAAEASYRYWVTADRLNRHTCPSTDCGIVGWMFFRQGAHVFEERDGWARVSRYYDALCVNGRSEYVDSGASRCDPDNGIIDGSFAEWVAIDFLSENRPTDPAADATGVEALVSGSDDFQRYRAVFARSAQSLMSSEQCSEADLRRGWRKSTLNYRNQPIYFLYCGGLTVSNRLYLNTETGEIFR